MKNNLIIILWMAGFIFSSVPSFSQSPEEVLRNMEQKMFPDGRMGLDLMVMSDGEIKEQYRMIAYTKNLNRNVLIRMAPNTRGGVGDILMNHNVVWTLDNRSNRIIRVPANQIFGGTGFSYGDVLRLNFSINYHVRITQTTEKIWYLELTAKNRLAPYYRVVLRVGKDFYPYSGDFYSASGVRLKSKVWRDEDTSVYGEKPMEVQVTSEFERNKINILRIAWIEEKKYPDDIFNRLNLISRSESNIKEERNGVD